MVLEELSKLKIFKGNHPFLIFFLGLFYTVFSCLFASMIFKDNLSVLIMFLITLLLIPTLAKSLNKSEKVDSKEGIKHFFHNHKTLFSNYLFLLKGVFFGFLLVGLFVGANQQTFDNMFGYQIEFLNEQSGTTEEFTKNIINENYIPSVETFISILTHNASITLIAFFLSLFYGAGAIFLIVLNSSVFATFILFVINFISKSFSQGLMIVLAFMAHLLPELAGFLIAAIAGGVLSKAFMNEKIGTSGFRNVVKDATFLLLISLAVIILAAFLEVFVSPGLLLSLI